jgi:hypothetical protein
MHKGIQCLDILKWQTCLSESEGKEKLSKMRKLLEVGSEILWTFINI